MYQLFKDSSIIIHPPFSLVIACNPLPNILHSTTWSIMMPTCNCIINLHFSALSIKTFLGSMKIQTFNVLIIEKWLSDYFFLGNHVHFKVYSDKLFKAVQLSMCWFQKSKFSLKLHPSYAYNLNWSVVITLL